MVEPLKSQEGNVVPRKKEKKKKLAVKHEGLFTVHVGPVGSGKTFSMVERGIAALRNNEPVFTNTPLSLDHLDDLKNTPRYDNEIIDEKKGLVRPGIERYAAALSKNPALARGPALVEWAIPIDLLNPALRCGTVLFDELGALVNNRHPEDFPQELTNRLIHLRKFHLNLEATVQDDEMADKNIRRFYNKVWFLSEWHLPVAGLFKKSARRPILKCELPGCTKNHARLTEGDRPGTFPYYATIYARKDVHPKYTQNKEKHLSKGTSWLWFHEDIAKAYQSAHSVERDANYAYIQAKNERKVAYDRHEKKYTPKED